MSGIKFNIDVQAIAATLKEFATEVEQDLQKAAGDLAIITKEKVVELAANELKTTSDEFIKNVGVDNDTAPGIFIVYINEKSLWQEDGLPKDFDMKPGMLSSDKAKISKVDGHRYMSVPFKHSNNTPTNSSPKALAMVSQIKSFLKSQNVPYKKIEKNKDGSPRLGKLHQFDLPSEPPTDRASTSGLKGLSIYQSKTKSGGVRRDIMTFRTVTEGPGSAGKWIHPGYQPKHFLDRAAEWATQKWENEILPEILDKWK